jgi:hypothetical protein
VEGGILVPQSLDMLLKEGHPLQVEHVLRVLSHRSHDDVEVRTLWVGHVLKMLPPHGLLLLTNQKQCDWHRGGVVEVAPT